MLGQILTILFGGPLLSLGGNASISMHNIVKEIEESDKEIHILSSTDGSIFKIVYTPKKGEAQVASILAEGLVPGNPGAVTSFYDYIPNSGRFNGIIKQSLLRKIEELRNGNGELAKEEFLQELVRVGRIKSIRPPYTQ